MGNGKVIRIKIDKKDLPKRRSGVLPSKRHDDKKTTYKRIKKPTKDELASKTCSSCGDDDTPIQLRPLIGNASLCNPCTETET